MENNILYFEKTDSANTDTVLQLVKENLETHKNISKIVLASTTGNTAKKAINYFENTDVKLIVIPHQYDFGTKTNRFSKELTEEIRSSGHEVHFGSMLFHLDKLFDTAIPSVIADFLRCFSEGFKVCYEIVLMATDAGLIDTGEQIIAIAGTGLGADTALIMQAASTQNLRKLRINEVICKPLNSY